MNVARSLACKPAAVVFDMDGLLLDTERLHQQAVLATCGRLGFEMTQQLLLSLVGGTRADNAERLVRAFGVTFPLDAYHAECRSHFAKLCAQGIELRPGAMEMFSFLEEHRIPIAVATSTVGPTATHHLREAGLLARLAALVTRDDVTHGKPHPEPYLKAARHLGAAPADCLALEDSHSGARSALAAGMPTVLVPDLLPATPEIADRCVHVAEDLHEVRRMILALPPRSGSSASTAMRAASRSCSG